MNPVESKMTAEENAFLSSEVALLRNFLRQVTSCLGKGRKQRIPQLLQGMLRTTRRIQRWEAESSSLSEEARRVVHEHLVATLCDIGHVYYFLNLNSEALSAAEEAWNRLAATRQPHLEAVKVCRVLAVLYHDDGRVEDVKVVLSRAAEIAKEIELTGKSRAALQNIVYLCLEISFWEPAEVILDVLLTPQGASNADSKEMESYRLMKLLTESLKAGLPNDEAVEKAALNTVGTPRTADEFLLRLGSGSMPSSNKRLT